MIYLPPLRRLLLPSLLCLAFILYYKSTVRLPTTTRQQLQNLILRQPDLTPILARIPVRDTNAKQIVVPSQPENYRSPPTRFYYNYNEPGAAFANGTEIRLPNIKPDENPHLEQLWKCPRQPNPITDHIRLPNPLYNISVVHRNETENEKKGYLNPAIISLPHWSENQFILVSRVTTDGSHQHNLVCEANICYNGPESEARPGEKPCGKDDLELLGGNMGMRCASPPTTLNVPPTPAKSCGKDAGVLMDIPGFHDPRLFWSGKGEPLMMVNSQSRYACFGLWMIDLRVLLPSFERLLATNPARPGLGPLMSYPHLTELTRNPADTRGPIEKNWMFFGDQTDQYLHYDMSSRKRTFAKVVGGGLTTVNLTDPRELPCLEDAANPNVLGSWHQGTNSLRLVLCDRSDENCRPELKNEVYFSLIHHKHKNALDLPLRYERYFIVWSAEPPFSMLGISKHPILMYNETASGFEPEENWQDDQEQQQLVEAGEQGKGNWAYFTYTVSLAWAWGRKMDEPQNKNTGYLDDEVVLGVGVDDATMTFSRVVARDLLQCLKACPGRGSAPLYRSPSEEDSTPVAPVANIDLPTKASAPAESSSGESDPPESAEERPK